MNEIVARSEEPIRQVPSLSLIHRSTMARCVCVFNPFLVNERGERRAYSQTSCPDSSGRDSKQRVPVSYEVSCPHSSAVVSCMIHAHENVSLAYDFRCCSDREPRSSGTVVFYPWQRWRIRALCAAPRSTPPGMRSVTYALPPRQYRGSSRFQRRGMRAWRRA